MTARAAIRKLVVPAAGKPFAESPRYREFAETARRGAERALARITEDLARFDHTSDRRLAAHRHFLRVYRFTTRRWLRELSGWSDPVLAHLVIAHFHDRYVEYVLRVAHGETGEIAPQWRAHFAIVRRSGTAENPFDAVRLVYWGLRAHTGRDLAEAIALSALQYRTATGREPDWRSFRKIMLGPHSTRQFYLAARDFLHAEEATEGPVARLVAPAQARRYRRIWLPLFQARRHLFWQVARRKARMLMKPDPVGASLTIGR